VSAPAAGDERASAIGRGRWTAVLLVRLGAFVATVFLLQLSGTAAWDAHLLGVRGEVRAAEVVAVRHTSWGKADRATLAVTGEPATVRVATPRKDLEVGQTVGAVVDPRDRSVRRWPATAGRGGTC